MVWKKIKRHQGRGSRSKSQKSGKSRFGARREPLWVQKFDVCAVLRTMFLREMACRDGLPSGYKQYSSPVGGQSARLTPATICNIWPLQPAISFDPTDRIQYPSVKTWVRVIVWPMQSDSSVAYLCEKFWLGQGRAEISKITKIMVWDT